MAAELKTPLIEFIEVGGLEARKLDPLQMEWPEDSFVIFVAQDGDIVGRSSLSALPAASILNYPVIEGTWVREDKRGSTLAYRLLKKVEDVFIREGKTHAVAFIQDQQPEIGAYMARLGYEHKEVSMWVKQLVGE